MKIEWNYVIDKYNEEAWKSAKNTKNVAKTVDNDQEQLVAVKKILARS